MGLTIVLTTHYLEEAEEFCQRLAIIKRGEIITLKTQRELLSLGGKPRMEFQFEQGPSEDTWQRAVSDNGLMARDASAAEGHKSGSSNAGVSGNGAFKYTAYAEVNTHSPESIAEACNRAAALSRQLGVALSDSRLVRPSLEDVFLKLTR
jgi:ABC-2 type transport system ATP-binding protein